MLSVRAAFFPSLCKRDSLAQSLKEPGFQDLKTKIFKALEQLCAELRLAMDFRKVINTKIEVPFSQLVVSRVQLQMEKERESS